MKKYSIMIAALAFVAALSACSGRTADGTSTGDTQELEVVNAEVVEIYDPATDTSNAQTVAPEAPAAPVSELTQEAPADTAQ